MITSATNEKFKAYAAHVLKWEGLMDSDPHDNAAKCIPGKIHTVRGVTYCNFKDRAAALGITPVTHERFVKMTAADATKFIYDEYKNNPWVKLPDASALSMTEAAWGSGGYAYNNAIDTLNALKIPGVPARRSGKPNYTNAEKTKIIELINKIPQKTFFDTFWQQRYNWLDALGKTAYGAKYRRGWLNRQNEFKQLRDTLTKGSDPFFFPIVLIGSYFAYKMLKKR